VTDRLAGKVALITGAGGSAIGRTTASRFAREGATLICADREKDAAAGEELVAELVAGGAAATAVTVDLQTEASIREMLEDAVDRHGRLDVLFNLMVWGRPPTPGDWQWMQNATFVPTYFGTYHGADLMARHGGGSIVNASSIAGVVLSPAVQPLPPIEAEDLQAPTPPGPGSYAAAKVTVEMLTREFAVRYGRRGVRVNAVAPGFMATPFTLSAYDPAFWERVEHAIPLGRLGRAEDIAATAAFLASDDAAYITGQLLVVDGGYSKRSAF
jgi:NAD(P)-dependent dehydrogenase (short-subunit alcohol dehydrogenase family)